MTSYQPRGFSQTRCSGTKWETRFANDADMVETVSAAHHPEEIFTNDAIAVESVAAVHRSDDTSPTP